MGTIVAVGPTVDEYAVGERIAVEIHAGCGRCERCRQGMYTSCLNYGRNYGEFDKGHRANGFTTDGGFAQYAVNHINTLVRVPDALSDELATLIVTAGTATYRLDVLGGLVAGQSLVVTGAGPIGLMVVAVAKALGAAPVILTDIRDDRLAIGTHMGADVVINASQVPAVDAVRRANGGRGVDYVFECSGAPNAVNDAVRMVSRGGRVSGAFSHQPAVVDIGYIVANNIYLRHTRRREERSAQSGVAHGTAQDRRVARAHAYVCARRAAHGAALYTRQNRRRDQSGDQAAGRSWRDDRQAGPCIR